MKKAEKAPRFLYETLSAIRANTAELKFCPYCQQPAEFLIDYKAKTFICESCGKEDTLFTLINDLCEAIHHYEFKLDIKVSDEQKANGHILQLQPSKITLFINTSRDIRLHVGFNLMNLSNKDD